MPYLPMTSGGRSIWRTSTAGLRLTGSGAAFPPEAWDASILRKLETLESIYDKMSARATTRRMEVLEWIIIVLIAVSIALSIFPGTGAH